MLNTFKALVKQFIIHSNTMQQTLLKVTSYGSRFVD